MKSYGRYLLMLLVIVALLLAVRYYLLWQRGIAIDEYDSVGRPARIHPDYANTVIPPNIAPLNFLLQEQGTLYYVKIYSEQGEAIEIQNRKPKIRIPMRRWKKLLKVNRGNQLYFDVYVRNESGQWNRFETITNTIADADIDDYLVYRRLRLSVTWKNMGMYQRNLESFNESIVLHNSSIDGGCINCHSFLRNSSDNMLAQIRSSDYGTPMIMVRNGQITTVNTSTDFTPGKVGFTAWHPHGSVIAFSINKFEMFFHTAAVEVRDVISHASDLALYLLDSNRIISTSKITSPDRMETFPEWSPDGRYLYFCSSPQLPVERYREVRCDLMRISYDCKTQKWGDLETVLTAQQVNGSILEPKFSPDGRFLLFNVSEYSAFPIHQAKSDLYLMETETGQYHKLTISSDRNDAWHSWSSNGRWIVFSSKRIDGRFARPFFSYVDNTGKACKPFLLPQKDPLFYDSLVQAYNIPELIKSPIRTKAKQLSNSIFAYRKAPRADIITGATPGVPATPAVKYWAEPYDESWQQRE